MIYIYSIKGIWKLELDSNIQTIIDLKNAYIQKYPEFNLDNIQIYDDTRTLLYDQDSLNININININPKYFLVIRPIVCHLHQ
jgi:hypothetical protein